MSYYDRLTIRSATKTSFIYSNQWALLSLTARQISKIHTRVNLEFKVASDFNFYFKTKDYLS